MNHIGHAIEVALAAHEGQTDKTGRSYFEHCRRVADAVQADDAKIVAYLHDVAEKGRGWTLDRLREEGFSPEIVTAVDALTRRDQEAWNDFVHRAGANSLARLVKQADLEDNLAQVQTLGEDGTKYVEGLVLLNGTL
jgi:(p)ppGpp synthase/HD superfamily hydrolase